MLWQTVCEVEVVGDSPLVLSVETNLSCRELRHPALCSCYRLYALTIAETCNVAIVEIVRRIVDICAVKVLAEEVAELVELIVCTEGDRVTASVDGEVVGKSIDVLIELVGH